MQVLKVAARDLLRGATDMVEVFRVQLKNESSNFHFQSDVESHNAVKITMLVRAPMMQIFISLQELK